MSRALILSLLFPSVIVTLVVACSGSTLPVAEDGCSGVAPTCFGSDPSTCCGQDPSGTATCTGGTWKCGSAGAPGCNGASCLAERTDGGTSGCIGAAPACFGNDLSSCCGQDPGGSATCTSGKWMCGASAAPGCNGTSCLLQNADGGATGCSPACGSNQVCVSQQQVGGGEPFPDDAGNCPAGTVHAGDRCAPPPTYACGPYPAACVGNLDCTCAASVCTGNYMCSKTSPGEVDCVFGAP